MKLKIIIPLTFLTFGCADLSEASSSIDTVKAAHIKPKSNSRIDHPPILAQQNLVTAKQLLIEVKQETVEAKQVPIDPKQVTVQANRKPIGAQKATFDVSKQIPIEIKLSKDSDWSIKDIIYLLTTLAAFVTLFIAIQTKKIAKINRLEDQFLDEIDNFWFKEVVTPKVLNPTFDFISNNYLIFKDMSPLGTPDSPTEAFIELNIERLTDETTQLQLALNLLASIPHGKSYYDSVKEEIDTLEDNLSCFLFSVEDSSFDNDTESGLHKFGSMQDIFSYTQGQVLELTKKYRNETKVIMKNYALKNNT